MREKGERGDGKETKGKRRGKKGKEGGKGKGGILCSCDFFRRYPVLPFWTSCYEKMAPRVDISLCA